MPIRINRPSTFNEEDTLVHSFSENFIYAFPTENKLKNKLGVNFSDLINKETFSVLDFFVEEKEKMDFGLNKIFKNLKPKSINEREIVKRQVHTGNLAIDFTNPIFAGSLNTINTHNKNPLKRNKVLKNMLKFNKNTHFIYISPRKEKTKAFENFAKENKEPASFNTISFEADDKFEMMLLLRTLPHYMDYIRVDKRDVVLVVDDVESLYYKLFNLHRSDNDEVTL